MVARLSVTAEARRSKIPGDYSDVTKGLLRDIGIDIPRLGAGYDQGFYRRHGLRAGTYFDRATYGVDRVIPYELTGLSELPAARAFNGYSARGRRADATVRTREAGASEGALDR